MYKNLSTSSNKCWLNSSVMNHKVSLGGNLLFKFPTKGVPNSLALLPYQIVTVVHIHYNSDDLI